MLLLIILIYLKILQNYRNRFERQKKRRRKKSNSKITRQSGSPLWMYDPVWSKITRVNSFLNRTLS